MPLTPDDLRLATLARQFPAAAPSPDAELLAATGPIQSQTARSTFLGLAARSPGVTHAALTEAFEQYAIVRGSTVRGTVHTATPWQQAVLDAVTRVAQRTLWARTFRLDRLSLEDVWSAIEAYAWAEWRTPVQLAERLHELLTDAGEAAALASLARADTRYFAFGHGGLVRRPLTGGWEAQGRPGYRAAEAVTGVPRLRAQEALPAAVLLHLRCHGPATRHDIAWWSGLGLRTVDEVVAGLGDDLVHHDGPDGRTYLDVRDAAAPREVPGVVLLPEFDALLCGYDPTGRHRIITPVHHAAIWSSANGLMLAPLLVDGRITGYWRMTGSARKRPIEVRWFAHTRRPRQAELAEPVARVEAALGITVSQVTISRA